MHVFAAVLALYAFPGDQNTSFGTTARRTLGSTPFNESIASTDSGTDGPFPRFKADERFGLANAFDGAHFLVEEGCEGF